MLHAGRLFICSVRIRLTYLFVVLSFAVPIQAQEIERSPRKADSPLDRPLAELRHVNMTGSDKTHGGFLTIAQSPDGFLWLASSVGLLRFDGVHFDNTYARRLPSLRTYLVHADNNGDIWVGYINPGGLSRIRGGKIVNYRPGVDVPGGTLHAMVRGPDGRLWAASTTGVARMVGDRWVRVGADLGLGEQHPLNMVMSDGTLWITGATDAWYLKPGATKFGVTNLDKAVEDEFRRLGTPDRHYDRSQDDSPYVDSSGALWIVRFKGFERDRWVTDENGRTHRVAETFTRANGLSGNHVAQFFEDREGSMWVITDQGIDQFRATNLRPVSLPEDVHEPFVVPVEGNKVLIPSFFQSPLLLAGSSATTVSNISPPISTATRDKHGTVWMAGKYGVSKYENGTVTKIDWPPEFNGGERILLQSIAMDDTGVLWAGVAFHGLYQFKGGSWTKVDFSEYPWAKGNLDEYAQGAPYYMLDDALGRLWLAYPHDNLIVIDHGKVRHYGNGDGLKTDALQAIEATRSHVWAGGERGLFLLKGDRFIQIKGKSGDEFSRISGIVEMNNGDLWLNALNGAYRIEATELTRAQADPSYEVAFQLFGPSDGRLGQPAVARPLPQLVKSNDGRLWFSTETSVAWLSPQHIMRNTVAPTVLIDAISDGQARYPASGDIKLPPRTRRVEIEYTAASLANPDRVHFHYRLDGVDNDWQDAGDRRSASYTNLGPTSYRFHVQATNEDGVVSEGDSSFAFTILPAWYQTMVFKALCVLLALVLLVALYVLRIRYMRARIRMSLEARSDERDRIARDLHDTLLQSVQGLILHVQAVADRMVKGQQDRATLENALDCAERAVTEARSRVLELRSKTCSDFHEVLEQTGKELTADQSMHFKLLIEGRPRELTTQVHWEVLSIAREAMLNALQHSNGTLLEAEIAYLSTTLRVRLRDDGIGIPREVLESGRPNHWGIHGMHERADKISAKLRIWSREGEGCEIEIVVPASVAYFTRDSGFQRMVDRMLKRGRY
jgi:signal transduction histidine kinase/ligand-binding sensor domain-containing protein